MTSYNLLNGIHTANSHDLIQGMARDEWGFKGVVTSISTSAPMEDNIPFEASIKVSGKPTLTIS